MSMNSCKLHARADWRLIGFCLSAPLSALLCSLSDSPLLTHNMIHVAMFAIFPPLSSPTQRRSWLLRLCLAATVLVLLVCLLPSAEAASASASKVKKTDKTASSAASSASSSVDAEALRKREELQRKRQAKRDAARAASLRAAQQRNKASAQRRAAKKARQAKAETAAKQRAEAIAAKKRKADTPEMRRRSQEKLRALLSLAGKSSTRIINFDSAAFQSFVNEGPRPYHLVLTFTALTSQHSCPYCHMVQAGMAPTAIAHYGRSKEVVSHVLSGGTSPADLNEDELPVFFANIDMARNGPLFKEVGFNSAPYVVLAPPRLGTTTQKSSEFMKALPQKYRFNLQQSMSSSDFVSFVGKCTQIYVNVETAKPGFMDLLFSLLILALIAFVGIKYGPSIIVSARQVRSVRTLLLIGGCALYCWCISGGMYNIIRGTQFAETRKDGSVNYINGDPRDQYAAEGLIIGVLNLACAGVIIIANIRAFDEGFGSVTGVSGVSGVGVSKSRQQPVWVHLLNAIAPALSPMACLGLAFGFWFKIVDIYSRKNWGYRYGFVWRW